MCGRSRPTSLLASLPNMMRVPPWRTLSFQQRMSLCRKTLEPSSRLWTMTSFRFGATIQRRLSGRIPGMVLRWRSRGGSASTPIMSTKRIGRRLLLIWPTRSGRTRSLPPISPSLTCTWVTGMPWPLTTVMTSSRRSLTTSAGSSRAVCRQLKLWLLVRELSSWSVWKAWRTS